MSKTMRAIVAEWLRANGYDGLASDDCGCEVDDLFVCESPQPDCVAGHKRTKCPCPKADTEEGCEGAQYANMVNHWCMAAGDE